MDLSKNTRTFDLWRSSTRNKVPQTTTKTYSLSPSRNELYENCAVTIQCWSTMINRMKQNDICLHKRIDDNNNNNFINDDRFDTKTLFTLQIHTLNTIYLDSFVSFLISLHIFFAQISFWAEKFIYGYYQFKYCVQTETNTRRTIFILNISSAVPFSSKQQQQAPPSPAAPQPY